MFAPLFDICDVNLIYFNIPHAKYDCKSLKYIKQTQQNNFFLGLKIQAILKKSHCIFIHHPFSISSSKTISLKPPFGDLWLLPPLFPHNGINSLSGLDI